MSTHDYYGAGLPDEPDEEFCTKCQSSKCENESEHRCPECGALPGERHLRYCEEGRDV